MANHDDELRRAGIKKVEEKNNVVWMSHTPHPASGGGDVLPPGLGDVQNQLKQIIQGNGSVAPLNGQIWRGAPSEPGLYAQEALEEMLNLKEGDTLTAVDIENIGSFLRERDKALGETLPKSATDIFGITEVSLYNYKLKGKQGSWKVNNFNGLLGANGFTLGVKLDKSTEGSVRALIERVKNSSFNLSLNEHEYRSLFDLIKYKDASKFNSLPNPFNPNNKLKIITGHAKGLPSYGASLKSHIGDIEAGLNNLMDLGSNPKAVKGFLTKYLNRATSTYQNHRILGQNQIIYDNPVLSEAFGISGFKNTKNIDTMQLMNTAFNDIRELVDFGPGSIGSRKLENLAVALNLVPNGQAHFSGDDVKRTAELFNILANHDSLQSLIKSVKQGKNLDMPGYLPGRVTGLSSAAIDNLALGTGSIIYSSKGAQAAKLGAYDTIFDASGNALDRQFYKNSVYANTYYKIENMFETAINGKTKYGIQLFNMDENLRHVIVRDDLRELQNFVHGTFANWSATEDKWGALQKNSTTRGYILKDRARRRYEKMFTPMESGSHGYYLAKQYVDVYDKVSGVKGSKRWKEAQKILSKGNHARDFQYMWDRFSSEAKYIGEFIKRIEEVEDTLTPYQRDLAMHYFKKEMLGEAKETISLPGSVRQASIGEHSFNLYDIKGIKGKLWGIANQGNGKQVTVGSAAINLHQFLGDVLGDANASGRFLDYTRMGIEGGISVSELEKLQGRLSTIAAQSPTKQALTNEINTIANIIFKYAHPVDGVEVESMSSRGPLSKMLGSPDKRQAHYTGIINKVMSVAAPSSISWTRLGEDRFQMNTGGAIGEVFKYYQEATDRVFGSLSLATAGKVDRGPGIEGALSKVASAYVGKKSGVDVAFLQTDGKYNGLKMAVFARQYANEVLAAGSLENAAVFDIPLLDESGIISKGRVNKINQFYFSVNKEGKTVIETGAERILSSLSRSSYYIDEIKKAVLGGDLETASKLGNRVVNKAIEKLSGASTYVDLARENALETSNRALNWLRGGMIHVGGAIDIPTLRDRIGAKTGRAVVAKKYEDLGLEEQATFMREVKETLRQHGISTNFQSVKDSHVIAGILNTRDVRRLLPFGAFSQYTSYAAYQAQNYYNLDGDKLAARGLADPHLMTNKSMNVYDGDTPWMTGKAIEAHDGQINSLVNRAEEGIVRLSDDEIMAKFGVTKEQILKEIEVAKRTASTYEGNAIARQSMMDITNVKANSTHVIEGKNIELSDAVLNREKLRPGDTLGTIDGEVIPYKYNQSGRLVGDVQDVNGKFLLNFEKDMDSQIGTKFMTRYGDKFTVGNWMRDTLFDYVFGDAANGANFVIAPATMKHKDAATLLSKNIAYALHETKITVADAEKAATLNKVVGYLNTYLGVGATLNDKGIVIIDETFAKGITPKQGVELFRGLHEFMNQTGKLIGKDLTKGIRVGDQTLNVAVHSILRTATDEDTLVSSFDFASGRQVGLVKYGHRELEMLRKQGLGGRGIAKWIKDQKYIKDESKRPIVALQGRMEQLKKANRAVLGIGPEVADARVASVYDTVNGNPLLRDIPAGSGLLTEADYSNTILDKMANDHKKGAWFDLADKVEVEGQTIDKVFFTNESFIKAPGGDKVYLSDLQQAQRRVFTASHEYRAGRRGDLKAEEMEKLYENMTGAVDNYQKEVRKAMTATKGEIAGDILTAKMDHSARFRIKILSPTAQIAKDGAKPLAEEGTWYISETMAKQMMDGAKDADRIVEQMRNEGVYGLSNRFPTMYESNIVSSKIKIADWLKDSTGVYMTVGDAMRMKGDQDGDWLSVVLAHYGKGDEAAIKSAQRLHRETLRGERGVVGQAEITKYLDEASNDLGLKSTDELINLVNEDSTSGVKARSALDELLKYRMGIEDDIVRESRLGKSYTGVFSNVATKIRRVTEAAVSVMDGGKSVVTVGDAAKNINAFGAWLEQKMISSKKATMDEATIAAKMKVMGAVNQLGGTNTNIARQTIVNEFGTLNIMPDSTKDFDLYKALDALEEVGYLTGGDKGLGVAISAPSVNLYMSEGADTSARADAMVSFGQRNIYDIPTVEKGRLATTAEEIAAYESDKAFFAENVIARRNNLARTNARRRLNTVVDENILANLGEKTTVGDAVAAGIRTAVNINIGGNMGSALWGAAGLVGASFIHNVTKKNPIPPETMPQADQAPMGDGSYIPTPHGTPPKRAYVQARGSGYENMQLTIKARDAAGMSNEEIGQLVMSQLERQMPVKADVKITSNDNTQRIDRMWLEQQVANALW